MSEHDEKKHHPHMAQDKKAQHKTEGVVDINQGAKAAADPPEASAEEQAQKIAGDVSPLEEARARTGHDSHSAVEDLGSQMINGVLALGVRITSTIPVGAEGNDRELKNVVEEWYSNDIHAVVKSVNTNPRFGTTTYELTNIVRAQQDPALFQVPAGYTVTTPGNPRPVIRKEQ